MQFECRTSKNMLHKRTKVCADTSYSTFYHSLGAAMVEAVLASTIIGCILWQFEAMTKESIKGNHICICYFYVLSEVC